MREYVVVPPKVLADPRALAVWVGRAFAFGLTLPEKKKRSPTAGKRTAKRRR
jgi:hypothetical protein